MKVLSRQRKRRQVFAKKIGAMFSYRQDFHIAMLTVVHDMMQSCCEETATTLKLFKITRAECFGGGTVGSAKTIKFTCSM